MPFIELDDKKIYYQSKLVDNDRALIFIHGAGENLNIWENQFKVEINYNLIAIDLPSHGKSDNFSKLSLDLYISSIKALLEKLNFNKIVLCGHSMGGAIAQSYYLKFPDEINALILCATGSHLKTNPLIFKFIKENYQKFLDVIPPMVFHRNTSNEIVQNWLKELDPEIIYDDFKICDKFDTFNQTSLIDVPSLIICGKSDRLTPLKYSEYLHEKIKNSELTIIQNAGHGVMMEKPDEVNKAIEDFCEKNY